MRKSIAAKSTVLAIIILLAAVALTITAALAVNYFMFPQNGTVPGSTSVAATINGTSWTSGTSINWGNLGLTQTATLAVTNTGNHQITVAFVVDPSDPLPQGWTEVWTPDATILNPGETATGLLTLTLPGDVVAGPYSWSGYIDVT